MPGLRKIEEALTGFRSLLNGISQDELGDKGLRVDEEEIVLTRFNGAS